MFSPRYSHNGSRWIEVGEVVELLDTICKGPRCLTSNAIVKAVGTDEVWVTAAFCSRQLSLNESSTKPKLNFAEELLLMSGSGFLCPPAANALSEMRFLLEGLGFRVGGTVEQLSKAFPPSPHHASTTTALPSTVSSSARYRCMVRQLLHRPPSSYQRSMGLIKESRLPQGRYLSDKAATLVSRWEDFFRTHPRNSFVVEVKYAHIKSDLQSLPDVKFNTPLQVSFSMVGGSNPIIVEEGRHHKNFSDAQTESSKHWMGTGIVDFCEDEDAAHNTNLSKKL
ncbi:hypothetical protein P691DRAFT_789026 [Macrolepiota fuliginosa MF-IS2]|uniref:Uncharacterized protein n=1 Tax=Macrolepiota fuliginosa MF-IS2 TaxID=1400762 RepID=A0A9P5X3M2_9AGAR|nr:hypothetical protein P691DRAFT_789026 [Macrolepiota fuliginosa MF-IS2]